VQRDLKKEAEERKKTSQDKIKSITNEIDSNLEKNSLLAQLGD